MKAARIQSFGPAETLTITETETPVLDRPGDVLVRVMASGVNAIEWKIRNGAMARALGRPLPVTLGWEFAGVVAAVGSAVRGLPVGAAVHGYPEFTRDGSHAEYVLVDAAQLAVKPATLSFEQAAAVPMTAQAAWSVLEAAGDVAGQRVLIHGAGGAVGHWLVQLAKQHGARVTATVSQGDAARVAGLGADRTLDYRVERFEDAGPFDLVFDLVGGETQARSWSVLSSAGLLVSTVQPPDQAQARAAGAAGRFVFTAPRGAVLSEIDALIESRRLVPLDVAQCRPLDDIALVYAEGEAGNRVGKTVLVIGTA
ncbi:MAG: NADP-dependent oxidoreductase [Burkholderiaceae bacterium]